jgi:arylsulfatase A-like enzyme
VTLAEILSANGYQTGAVIGSFPLDSVYGLDQGFETYDDEFSLPIFRIPGRPVKKVESRLDEDPAKQSEFVLQKLLNDAYRPDEAVTDAAIRWLERTRDGRPFFLWVHYFGPHEKTHWDQTFTAQVPEIIAAYDPEVEAADRAVGRLLDRLRSLGLLDVALVVLHSDHGQSLGEHDYVGHSLDLYDVSVRIPLIVRFPGRFPAGTRRRELVRNVDVFPTILDVVGIDGPRPGAGRSLVEPPGRAPGARTPDRSEVAYFETYTSALVPDRTVTAVAGIGRVLGPVIKTGLRTAQWKVIVGRFTAGCSTGDEMARDPSGRYYFLKPVAVDEHRCRAIEAVELYPAAIAEEPASNIAAREPEVTAELKDLLAVLSAPGPYVRDEFRPSPEQAEKLRSLGYLQ